MNIYSSIIYYKYLMKMQCRVYIVVQNMITEIDRIALLGISHLHRSIHICVHKFHTSINS